MKILLVSDYYPPDKFGGVGEVVKNLHKQLVNHGHRVKVLTSGHRHSSEVDIIRTSPRLILATLKNIPYLLKLLKEFKPDIVHLHQPTFPAAFLVRLVKPSVPVVTTVHASPIREWQETHPVNVTGLVVSPTLKEYFTKYIFAPIHLINDFLNTQLAHVVTVVSSQNKKDLVQWLRIAENKIHFIPNGVDPKRFSPHVKSILPQGITLPLSSKIIMYLGVFRTLKRIPLLIDAFKKIHQKFPQTRLVLVGGHQKAQSLLKPLITRKGLEDKIYFVGQINPEEVPRFLALADIFVNPSAQEGMPLAVLEAMAMEKIVIVSSVGGHLDIIKNGKNGFLFPKDNVATLVNLLIRTLSNENLGFKIGTSARKTILANHTLTKVTNRYEKIYQLLLR